MRSGTLVLLLSASSPAVCAFRSSRRQSADWWWRPLNSLGARGSPDSWQTEYGFYDPLDNNGSMLTQVDDTYPAGLGEPLNVIISGASDSAVLVNQDADGGLLTYFQSLGFAGDCLGQPDTDVERANLGDGNGYINQTSVMRWDYGDPQLGTCTETIEGGNHFRYWSQDGSEHDTKSVFMTASYEYPLDKEHDIIPNGYNLARDYIVGNITGSPIPTDNLTNTTTYSYSGSTTANGYTYHTDIIYLSGLLQNTSVGINHYATVSVDGRPAIDGLVAVFTVSITGKPASDGTWIVRPSLSMLFALSILSMVPLVAHV